MFNGLGSDTCLFVRGEKPLRRFDSMVILNNIHHILVMMMM